MKDRRRGRPSEGAGRVAEREAADIVVGAWLAGVLSIVLCAPMRAICYNTASALAYVHAHDASIISAARSEW